MNPELLPRVIRDAGNRPRMVMCIAQQLHFCFLNLISANAGGHVSLWTQLFGARTRARSLLHALNSIEFISIHMTQFNAKFKLSGILLLVGSSRHFDAVRVRN